MVDDGLRYDKLMTCTAHPVITVSFDVYRNDDAITVENYTNITE